MLDTPVPVFVIVVSGECFGSDSPSLDKNPISSGVATVEGTFEV